MRYERTVIMADNTSEFYSRLLRELTKIDYVRPGEFPNIDLYMDQVTTFMNTHLSDSKLKSDDKILTKTMINNYAKNNLLPPPVKKKYSKEHMIVLIFIYYFKNILSISEIQAMLGPLTDKFFDPADNAGRITMEDIYNEVFASIKSQISTVSSDIEAKLEVDKEHFTGVRNRHDREFLQKFTMICMLGFDVFLKRQVIESLIDSISPAEEASSKKEPDKKVKKEAPKTTKTEPAAKEKETKKK